MGGYNNHFTSMSTLLNKNIILAVTGSVAAYKAGFIVRELLQQGAAVRVIMTRSACEFVSAMTFQALSGQPVYSELMDQEAEAAMGHIELARWADAVVVAPASANFIARLAQGRADDLLSAICLATQSPVAVAPAMNQQMWANNATQQNLSQLVNRGVHQLGPAEGDQACGETGPGRMLEAEDIISSVAGLFETGLLAGLSVVVTAGPTQEAIDPVRYISNRSSGKMGYAVAQAAAEAGAKTILVSGPTALSIPPRVTRVDVKSAQQMHDAVMDQIKDCDIFISAAAVADYRAMKPAGQKIKKQNEELELKLERNPDVLAGVAALDKGPFTVGFAAETEKLEIHAKEKLKNKKLDMVAANYVGEGKGFDQDENALLVLTGAERYELPQMSKQKLAIELITIIANHYRS